ncbi:MAG: aminopeptidase [Verrucomicrobiales bacterium]|nr:aminopeptidase [Verrucomicrobiales bacterium]
MKSRLLFLWLSMLVALSGTGCSTSSYYLQAVRGHLEIVSRQRPMAQVMADPRTSAAVSNKLRLVLELREFAAQELGLPVDGHYRRYADLGRRFVVWNVHAAPEFSLEAKAWWYPLVGRLKYRGFFSESSAHQLAQRLSEQGQEVYVGGVEAYSTLGWFRDPVLNTFLHHPPEHLAELLFHELAHQKLFVSGDTDFNEAFATTVGQEAARRWLASTGRAEALRRYGAEQEREAEFVTLVQNARRKLAELYRLHPVRFKYDPDPELVEALRRRKATVIAELRAEHALRVQSWGGASPYSAWFGGPLNHAQLNTVATYFDLVPGFQKLLSQCEGDLPRFYEEVRKLGQLPKVERRRRLLETAGTGSERKGN